MENIDQFKDAEMFIRLPQELKDTLEDLAKKHKTTLSEIARNLIAKGLKTETEAA